MMNEKDRQLAFLERFSVEFQQTVHALLADGAEPVSFEKESAVLLYKGKIYKVYPKDFTRSVIEDYARITKRVKEVLDGKEIILVYDEGKSHVFQWKFIPIDEIQEISGHVTTISEYVAGPTLREFQYQKGEQLTSLTLEENEQINLLLGSVNYDLKNQLFDNVHFAPINVKPQLGEQSLLIVTDVLSDLWHLI